jgi:hypothetical protein
LKIQNRNRQTRGFLRSLVVEGQIYPESDKRCDVVTYIPPALALFKYTPLSLAFGDQGLDSTEVRRK